MEELQHQLAHQCSPNIIGIWEWGICGLMGGAFYHLMGGAFMLNGWGICHLMGRAFHLMGGALWYGWGTYGLNGWGSYDKCCFVWKYAQKIAGLQGSTLSDHCMTTGFGPFELPTCGLLQRGRDHSPPKACFI